MANPLADFISAILGRPSSAEAFAKDGEAAMAAAGVTNNPVTQGDLQAAVGEACSAVDLDPQVKSALEEYVAGTPQPVSSASASASSSSASATATASTPPPPVVPVDQVLTPAEIQRQVEYITEVRYIESEPTIIQEIHNHETIQNIENTNIDNSTNLDLDVDGDLDGDIDITTTNVNATGDGAVAAGGNVENAVTGDGGVIVDGSNTGQVNTGDGAVQVADGSTVEGGIATGGGLATGADSQNVVGDGNAAIQAGDDIEGAALNTGSVGGNMTTIGEVDDAAIAVGDGAQSGNVSDIDGDNIGDIGQGVGGGITQVGTDDTAATQGGGNAFGDVDDSAVNTGIGTANNVSDLDDGSAGAVGGGDAVGSDINNAFNDNTNSAFEQGPGDFDQNLEGVEGVDNVPAPEPGPEELAE